MQIVIEDISWERAFLHITYRSDCPGKLMLFRTKTKVFIPLSEQRDGNVTKATLNLAQGFDREPLGNGEWIICQRLSEEEANIEWARKNAPFLVDLARKRLWGELPKRKKRLQTAQGVDFSTYSFSDEEISGNIAEYPFSTHNITYAPQLMGKLTELSHAFRYVKGAYAIVAFFIPSVDVTDYFFVKFSVDYFVRNKRPRRRKLTKRQIERIVFAAYYKIARQFLKSKKEKVLFLKENGDSPTENMAAIRDRMRERGLDGDFCIKERYRNTFTTRQNLGSWLKDINAIAGSKYIFIDDYCPVFNFVVPDEDTVLTQVWHAGVGFKSVGYARFGIKGSPDPFQCAHRRYDYALVGNEHLREIYSEVFGIGEDALLATGMPRLDHFLDESRITDAKKRLYAEYPWMQEGRVIVFAPTFRGSGQATAYYPYQEYLDFHALWEMCERTNSYFVVEMHHFVQEPPPIPEQYSNRIIDLSHESLNDLMYVSAVLVTDYSSCFYDCLLLQKPIVFYVPDKDEYSAIRGVQRPVDQMAPGIICETSSDLVGVLENESYAAVVPDASMMDRGFERSGLAADRVIDAILLGNEVPGVKASN